MKSPNPFVQLLVSSISAPTHQAAFCSDAQAMADAISAHDGYTMTFGSHKLWVAPGLYIPGLGSSTQMVLANWPSTGLENLCGKRVLDMGCGTGALSLFLLDQGAEHVVASDIDPPAVDCARFNLDNYARQGRAEVFQSDLFDVFQDQSPRPQFDLIVFNQPFHHPAAASPGKTFMLESVDGALFQRFLDEAGAWLTPAGQMLITFSSYSNPDLLDHPQWNAEVVGMDWTRRASHARALVCLTRKS